ncbi:hypothetical protein [Roseitranquillus sediminis]|uniref:hypothetical protein n=1 Tax=Roseitranquillus sediminis TaxID=2809051 RepID=UPI001D0C2C32|nr:hypothetical protein [Roseitranquillus sediminis]MBM9593400.1 hypothetical protein [Roseitranquillus sediminis]
MTDVLRILVAPLVWLAAFSGVYGLHGVGCAFGWADVELLSISLFRVALLAAWGAAVLLQLSLIPTLGSNRFGSAAPFVRRTSVALAWVGLVATLWTLLPVAVMSACD